MTDERKYSLMMAGSILATAAALTAFSFLGWHSSRSVSPVEQAGVGLARQDPDQRGKILGRVGGELHGTER